MWPGQRHRHQQGPSGPEAPHAHWPAQCFQGACLICCWLAALASGHPHHSAGAGDQYAAGFMYGVMRGYSTRKCAQLGCLAGGAVVQVVGAEMTPDSWRWVFARSALCHPPASSPRLVPAGHPGMLLLTRRLPESLQQQSSCAAQQCSAGWCVSADFMVSWRRMWCGTLPARCRRRCWRHTPSSRGWAGASSTTALRGSSPRQRTGTGHGRWAGTWQRCWGAPPGQGADQA